MHVALAIPHLRDGGAERTVARIARGLLGRGHRVDVVVFSDETAAGNELPKPVRRFVLKPERKGWVQDRLLVMRPYGVRAACLVSGTLIAQSRGFAKYLDRERPDCVLPSLPKMKVAAFVAARAASESPPIVPIVHNSLSRRGRKYRFLYSMMLPGAERIVAVSGGVSDDVIRDLGVAPGLVERIYNPIVSNETEALAEEAVDHPWLDDGGPPIVLAVGRLARVKDFPTLLRAFAQAARTRPTRLIILGDGRWRGRLERQSQELGIADKVWFSGWVSNPFPYMRKASVFVLSSRYEGLGNVLVEALACGCPCISTDCPHGPAEILESGRVGPLVRVGDAAALARAMERTLASPPDKTVLRARGQEFGVDRAIEHYERLILDVVRERRPFGLQGNGNEGSR